MMVPDPERTRKRIEGDLSASLRRREVMANRLAEGIHFRRLGSCSCGAPRYDREIPALVFVPPRRGRWDPI